MANQLTPTLRIQLPALTASMRVAFQAFYEDALSAVEPNAEALDEAAFAFFDDKGDEPGNVDDFFNAFTPLWSQRLAVGACGPAATVWTWALRPAIAWESDRGKRLHKGTAFYFSAMTAILAGDLDAGYLYAHRGLEEDRLTHGVVSPKTPSLSLVSIDANNVQQAFRPWVVEKAQFVERALDVYRQTRGRVLSAADLRAKLLDHIDRIEPTFLFSYSVARFRRLETMIPGGHDSDFGSQLRLNILFDLALVADNLLRWIAPDKEQFIDLAVALSASAPLQLTKDDFGSINGRFKADFVGTAVAILDGHYTLASGRQLAGLESDLAVAYGCRNRGGHHLSGGHVLNSRFDEFRQALLNTTFLAVESLP